MIERNGEKFFNIVYTYKGDLEDLQEVDRISFAHGTLLGSQVINLYDPSYKEKLINKGNFQEEYEEQYGIIVDEIKQRTTNEFVMEYALMESVNEDFTSLDAILKDGGQIIINWETSENKYEDKIQ